jgi:hypothetical protein
MTIGAMISTLNDASTSNMYAQRTRSLLGYPRIPEPYEP